MNKKILTLLAAGFMGSLSVSAFAAGSFSHTAGVLHQIKSPSGTHVLSVTKTYDQKADSLYMQELTTAFVGNKLSDEYKKTLWKVTESKVDNSTNSVYTFTNYYTGQVLSLDLSKTEGIIAPGQSAWLISASGEIQAIKNGVTYNVQVTEPTGLGGAANVVVDDRTSTTAPSQLNIGRANDANLTLTDDKFNGPYGTPSVLTFDKSLQGNPLDGVSVTAEAVTGGAGFNLRLADGQYLVVDTTTWSDDLTFDNYWKLTSDAKPAVDATPNIGSVPAGTTYLKNGRTPEVYQFKVSVNVEEEYKLTITPVAVPRLYGAATEAGKKLRFGNFMASEGAVQVLQWAQFAGSSAVMYATNTAAATNTVYAHFGVITAPSELSDEYVYYVQDWNPSSSNKEAYQYVKDLGSSKDNASKSLSIPAYMWYLDNTSGSVRLNNMQNTTVAYTGAIKLIDEAESLYRFSTTGDTLKLTKGPKITDAQKMAYKQVTSADEINGALSFRLVSVLAQDLYVQEKAGEMYVLNGELADATKFKTLYDAPATPAAANTHAGSNGLLKPEYYLLDRAQQNVLIYNTTANVYEWSPLSAVTIAAASRVRNAVKVAFYATGAENEYKIVYMRGRDKAITANAASGLLAETDRTNDDVVKFEFAKKDAPMYGAPKYGHVQITTLENDNKMITATPDGWAALKAEGQLLKSDVYTNDTLKLWLDTAAVVNNIAYYYLASTAFNEAGAMRNYLINPQRRYDDVVNVNSGRSDYSFGDVILGTYKVAFTPAERIGAAKDTLSIFGTDSIIASKAIDKNPAAVAFQVVVEEGDEVYNIISKNDKQTTTSGTTTWTSATWYMGQLNNVLFWTQDENKAEKFVINRTTAPTANEAIEAETGVEVIAGQGVVTVQGAAGKVITVSNILGQTIANQVAASDNVTIAAPAGVVVVTVDGEVVKTIVK